MVELAKVRTSNKQIATNKPHTLRRVVSVFAGTKEGRVYTDDLQALKNIPFTAVRGHTVSFHHARHGPLRLQGANGIFRT